MATYRKSARRRTNFTQVSNALAQDNTLSFQARGMLLYLLSKPDDWVGRPHDIEREGKIGNHARRTMVKDCEKAGYMAYRKVRDTVTGLFDSWYEVFDEPIPAWERTKSWENSINPPPNDQGVDDEPSTPQSSSAGSSSAGSSVDGQPGGILIGELANKELPKKEAAEAAATDDYERNLEQIIDRASLSRDHAEMILEVYHHAPASLTKAALDCWLEPAGREKRLSGSNPVQFLRGVLINPGSFGIVQDGKEWKYRQKSGSDGDPKARAIVDELKRRILVLSDQGFGWRTIQGRLMVTVKADLVQQAFRELPRIPEQDFVKPLDTVTTKA